MEAKNTCRMSIIHYVHLYLLLSHLHTAIIHRGAVPMLNCAGVKMVQKKGKKRQRDDNTRRWKVWGAGDGGFSHPRVNF